MEVHQVAVGASPGDAITSMMIEVRRQLRTVVRSEIYAYHIDPRLNDVYPLRDMRIDQRAQRVVVYHASIGEPAVTRFMLGCREPIVLAYHNITPSKFFVDSAIEIGPLLEWGRRELALLADKCVVAVADSDYNADDLRQYGYENVAVIPVGVNPNRLLGFAPDLKYRNHLEELVGHNYVLSVSQLFPHKRHELVVDAVHLARTVHDLDIGLVIVGVTRSASYRQALDALIDELALQNVHFAGSISDRQLATAYGGAAAFVTASEHEGLALPPLEAMAFGVPVIARRFGALPETVGSGGIVLEANSGPRHLAEALVSTLTDRGVASELATRGAERLAGWESSRMMARFLDLVADVL